MTERSELAVASPNREKSAGFSTTGWPRSKCTTFDSAALAAFSFWRRSISSAGVGKAGSESEDLVEADAVASFCAGASPSASSDFVGACTGACAGCLAARACRSATAGSFPAWSRVASSAASEVSSRASSMGSARTARRRRTAGQRQGPDQQRDHGKERSLHELRLRATTGRSVKYSAVRAWLPSESSNQGLLVLSGREPGPCLAPEVTLRESRPSVDAPPPLSIMPPAFSPYGSFAW